jgi:mannose-6-phosphate isomerase-like protein (cupin superfamily)
MNTSHTNTPRNFNGSFANVRVSANDNSSAISIIEHKLPFGYAPPLHVHKTQDEVFQILRGRIRFEVGGNIIVAQAGDILTAPKGIPHRFVVESREGAQALTVTQGLDFETFVIEASTRLMMEVAGALPQPTDKDLEKLTAASQRNQIEIVGPPLAA